MQGVDGGETRLFEQHFSVNKVYKEKRNQYFSIIFYSYLEK